MKLSEKEIMKLLIKKGVIKKQYVSENIHAESIFYECAELISILIMHPNKGK